MKTMVYKKPPLKPVLPFFSSGPCVKIPDWVSYPCNPSMLHRSHLSTHVKQWTTHLLDKIKQALNIPPSYAVFFVPGSGTGAIDALIYNLLGKCCVDLVVFDVFSKRWSDEVVKDLRLPHKVYTSAFGHLPDVNYIPQNDCLMVLHGTTTGVQFPDLNWIPLEREGLVLCDAVSAVFTTHIDWKRIDGFGFSWQKVLGAEAGLGTIVLSPRAVERLEVYRPSWPVPYLLNLRSTSGLRKDFTKGGFINTPSIIALDEINKALNWFFSCGGLDTMIQRVDQNYQVVAQWVNKTPWIRFCVQESVRSKIALTLELSDTCTRPEWKGKENWTFYRCFTELLSKENVAFDILNHKKAMPALRIWCGPTIEKKNLIRLCQWFDYAYWKLETSKKSF